MKLKTEKKKERYKSKTYTHTDTSEYENMRNGLKHHKVDSGGGR